MTEQVFPASPVDDTLTVWWVPGGVADMNAPKVSELTANSTVDISCYLMGEFGLKPDQSTWERKRRCSSKTYDVPGAVKLSFPEFTYAYDPQAATGAQLNKAQESLVPHSTGDFVIRRGVLYGTAPAAGQFVQIVRGQLGLQADASPEEQGDYTMQQSFAPSTDNPKVALVA